MIYSIVDNYSILKSWLKDELTILGLRTDQPRPPPQKKNHKLQDVRFYWRCLLRHSIGTVQMQEEFHIDFSPCICLGREMSDLLNNDESFVPTEKLF